MAKSDRIVNANVCLISQDAIDSVIAEIRKADFDATDKTVLWQDLVARLNRHGCLSNDEAEDLTAVFFENPDKRRR